MRQENHHVREIAELSAILQKIRDVKNYQSSKSVLIKVFTGNFFGAAVREIHDLIAKELPRAQVVSMSQVIHPNDENISVEDTRYISMNVCFFFETSITILEYDENSLDHIEAAGLLREQIAMQENLRAVEILCSGASKYRSHFIDIISKGNESIPFYGAEAGIASNEEFALLNENIKEGKPYDDIRQYVSAREYHSRGAVLILYAGESLNVKVDYILGWNPLGKVMRVTSQHGHNTIMTLDDMPAGNVYKKYLNVDLDEYFVTNISEFPMLVSRNGCSIARVPISFDSDKGLYFSGDIRKDDEIRLSYGNAQEILENTWKASEEMRKFRPEGIFLIMCGGRNLFMKEDARQEVEVFRRLHSQMTVCYATSEIYRHQGQGGLLNKALVAVGMREGVALSAKENDVEQFPAAKRKVIPLHVRLANFIQATTDELNEMAETANAANAAKSQFLSNMSHDIRTPINAILGMDEMILREFDNETLMEYASNIRNAGQNLLGLVNDILDFSKIEAGKMEIIPVDYEMSSLLNDLVSMIQKRASDKGLSLRVDADPAIPNLLHGDEIRIKQILTNLLTNAVKYTETGSITLRVAVEKTEGDRIDLHISVRDTGIGIRQEDIPKLFAAFERIEEKRNRKIEGTGLGMSITHRLLSLMNSELMVESVYGGGSEFSFLLRQQIVGTEPMGNFAEAYRRSHARTWEYREKFTAPEARVLVVDDTDLNLKVFRGLLKQTKVQIDTADSGADCLEMAKGKQYDIMFLDHRMPGMDGIETLEKWQMMEENPNAKIPVVALTANAVSGAREKYIAAGFTDYLTKPIDSSQLENMLMKYLPSEKIRPAEGGQEKRNAFAKKTGLPAWLRAVKELDIGQGCQNCGSDEAYLDALTIFAEQLSDNADEIERYFRQKEWKNYTTKVHALKSTARIIGAGKLSEQAKRLEDAGNKGNVAEIQADTQGLLELYRSYVELLAPLCPVSATSPDLPMISGDDLREAYETIREMITSFDYDSIMFVLESLEGYRLPETEQGRYKELRSSANKADWEALRRILAEPVH